MHNNDINIISSDSFKDLIKIKFLDLERNKIKVINNERKCVQQINQSQKNFN